MSVQHTGAPHGLLTVPLALPLIIWHKLHSDLLVTYGTLFPVFLASRLEFLQEHIVIILYTYE